jgi:hypothetical protein
VDEAHHLLPPLWDPASLTFLPELTGLILITVHPDQVAAPALSAVDTVITIGESAGETIRAFSRALGQPAPSLPPASPEAGQALAWWRRARGPVLRLRVIPDRADLAAEAARMARQDDLSPRESRVRIRAAIEGRYTGPT